MFKQVSKCVQVPVFQVWGARWAKWASMFRFATTLANQDIHRKKIVWNMVEPLNIKQNLHILISTAIVNSSASMFSWSKITFTLG